MKAKKEINVYTRPIFFVKSRLSPARRIWMAALAAYNNFMKTEPEAKEAAIAKAALDSYKVRPATGPGHVTVDSASRQDRSIYAPHQGRRERMRRGWDGRDPEPEIVVQVLPSEPVMAPKKARAPRKPKGTAPVTRTGRALTAQKSLAERMAASSNAK